MNTSITRQRSAHTRNDGLDWLVRRWAEQLRHTAAQLAEQDRPADADRQARDAQTLRQMVHANSRAELDWLCCAAIMTDPVKRRYCLERALAINPGSELAARALARLSPE
jgi:hypothetical protein